MSISVPHTPFIYICIMSFIFKKVTHGRTVDNRDKHYNDVIMSATTSQITSLTIVYSTVYPRRRSKKTSRLRVTGLCGEFTDYPCDIVHSWSKCHAIVERLLNCMSFVYYTILSSLVSLNVWRVASVRESKLCHLKTKQPQQQHGNTKNIIWLVKICPRRENKRTY